jgi:hemolysin III
MSRSSMARLPSWAPGEEFANSLTHGIAAVVFSIASFFIMRQSYLLHDHDRMIGMTFFCVAAVETYFASAIYHGLVNEKYKRMMRFVDHCSVYGLIASSYTAYSMTSLRTSGGIGLCLVVWAVGIVGIIGKLFFFDIVNQYTVVGYVGMGWIAVLSGPKFARNLSSKALIWLVAGGLSYTFGTYFFSRRRPFDHAIFHLFIIGGTACHAISLHYYV